MLHVVQSFVVKIFKHLASGRWPVLQFIERHLLKDFSIHNRSFHIEAVVHLVVMHRWKRVSLYHDIDWLEVVHLNCKNAINFCDQRLFVHLKVLVERRKDSDHLVDLPFVHRFQYELLVVGEYKELPTEPSASPGVLNAFNIVCSFKRLPQLVIRHSIILSNLLERLWRILCDFNISLDLQLIIFELLVLHQDFDVFHMVKVFNDVLFQIEHIFCVEIKVLLLKSGVTVLGVLHKSLYPLDLLLGLLNCQS